MSALPPDPPPPPKRPLQRMARPLVITGVVAVAFGTAAGATAAMTRSSDHSSSASARSSPAGSASSARTCPRGLRFHAAGPGGRFHVAGPGPRFHVAGPGPCIVGPFGAGFGGFPPIGFPPIGALGAIHGEFVVPKPGGGYQTTDTQRGTVTSVSRTSITLKSADGFIKTYTVTGLTIVDARRDGIGSVKAGDQAALIAIVSGGTATAAEVTDLTHLRMLPQRLFSEVMPPPPGYAG